MHHVDAEIGRAHLADDGVEVGAVAVEIGADLVRRLGDLDDLVLEQPAGVGIGHHDGGDVGPELFLELLQADPAVAVAWNALDLVAAGRRGRRIGAMGRFGHQHALARIALGLLRRADGEQPAEFAVRAGGRRHCHGRHAGQRLEPVGELVDQFERALHGGDRLQRMEVGEARQARQFFVQPRIVLHGAGAEREQAGVDRIILLRQAGEVADHLGLRQAGQAEVAGAREPAEPVGGLRHVGQIDARARRLALLEQQGLLDHEGAVAGDGARRRRRGGRRLDMPVARVHAHKTSFKPATSAAMWSSVVVSVAATSSRLAMAGSSG